MAGISELHEICLKIFDQVAKTTSIFVLPLFLMRIVFSNILGQGSNAVSAVKGVVIYFSLMAGFPLILDLMFSIPESFLPDVGKMGTLTPNTWASVSIIPFSLDRILEVVLAGLYWVACYLHVFFMLIMCSMAPIVFLLSTLLGIGLGLEVFLGLLIIGSSWPIIWHGFDQVHAHLMAVNTDAFASRCLELMLTFFKGFSPLAFATVAVKSPAGQAIVGATGHVLSAGRFVSVRTIQKTDSISTRADRHSVSKNSSSVNRSQGPGERGSHSSRRSNDRLGLEALKRSQEQKYINPNRRGVTDETVRA